MAFMRRIKRTTKNGFTVGFAREAPERPLRIAHYACNKGISRRSIPMNIMHRWHISRKGGQHILFECVIWLSQRFNVSSCATLRRFKHFDKNLVYYAKYRILPLNGGTACCASFISITAPTLISAQIMMLGPDPAL